MQNEIKTRCAAFSTLMYQLEQTLTFDLFSFLIKQHRQALGVVDDDQMKVEEREGAV